MPKEIKTWEIIDGMLTELNTSLAENGRKEREDLEKWIKTETSILGDDIRIIGEQVYTESGPLDYLGIDNRGNLVVIELKRDKLSREALAQAIDYASDVAKWEKEKISELCNSYTGQTIDDFIAENFENAEDDSFVINESQRLLLVGFAMDGSLDRMIEWLSDSYNVAINAILLSYVKTSSGNELISRTAIIPEEIEKNKINKKKYIVEKSDELGEYDREALKELFIKYLRKNLWSSRRIKNIMLPYLLINKEGVTRKELKREFLRVGGELGGKNTQQAGNFISLISNQLGQKKKDYLRQIILYEYPNFPWEKDNFKINPEYIDLVQEALDMVKEDKL